MASALLSLASKAARGSAAWAWKNSGAEDVPILAAGEKWFGKNLQKVAKKQKSPQEKREADAPTVTPEEAKPEQQEQPQTPKLTPVRAMPQRGPDGKFLRQRSEAPADPEAAIKKNREANARAVKITSQRHAPTPAVSPVPDQMVEDIHEIRDLLENQSQGQGQGGVLTGILGSLAGGMNLGRLSGVFKGLGQKIPGILKGAGGIAATAAAGTMAPSILSIPSKIRGALGNVKDMGTGIVDAAKTKSGALSAAGKGALEKGSGLIKGLAGKAGAKSLIKKIPGIGLLAGLGFGVSRAMEGDFTGAGMEVASGIAGTVPGLGTAASLGLDAALLARDVAGAPTETGFDDAKTPEQSPLLKRSYVEPTSDAVPRGIATLQDFAAAALDEDRGIFVRIVKDALRSQPQDTGVAAREKKREAPKIAPEKAPEPAFKKESSATTGFANSPLGDLIARGEGDYDSYNSGTKGVAGGKIGHSGKKPLSDMTLNEIIKSSETKDGNDKDRIFAAGRYQVITPTLKASMKKMGLTGDEKFTPQLQDRIFQETLLPDSVKSFVSGKSNDVKKAQVDLAQTWRSIADPRTGKTYADSGAVANKASITAAESEKALLQTRTSFQLSNPQQQSLGEIDAAAEQLRTKNMPQPTPVVIPVAAKSNVPAASGGDIGFGGHMGTRNSDSSIQRLTDARMSYGLS